MENSFSKKELIKGVTRELISFGYKDLSGPSCGSAALFYKRFGDMILTLGLELSTRYEQRFTASFYFSPSFHWGYMLSGLPIRAYQRIGIFLTPEERLRLLEPNFNEPGVVDAWWVGFNIETVGQFLEAVRQSESRFLAQEGLEHEIQGCEAVKKHICMALKVISVSKNLKDPPSKLANQPKHPKAKIPNNYYWAAELVLSESDPGLISPSYVELLAVDSWRIENLKR